MHLATTRHSSTVSNAGFSGGSGTSYDPGASGSANNDAEGTNPALLNDSPAGTYEQTADATGMTTATAEGLDDDTSGSEFREMGFLDREGHRHRSCSRPEGRIQHGTGTRPQGDSWSGC